MYVCMVLISILYIKQCRGCDIDIDISTVAISANVNVSPVDFFGCMISKCYLIGIGQILIFLSLAGSVSQPCGRVAVCGAAGMIHAISCLVNTPGTRLTLNTLMPTCPFYQPRAIQSSFHRRRRRVTADYFSTSGRVYVFVCRWDHFPAL